MTKPPTMRDVADRAGVSRQLVSLVLRGEPGPSVSSRENVLSAAAALGFRPNASARLLRQARTGLIGVLFEAGNPFEARFVERLLERAPDAGFGVLLAPVTATRTTEVVVSELLEHRIEALACFNPDPQSSALQHALATLPVVWLGERPGHPAADAVHADDEHGIRLIVTHLTDLGHSRIAYAGGTGGRVGPDRAASYRAAMREAGLAAHIDQIPVGFTSEDGATAARILLAREELPTAVIGCSDNVAAALLTVFAQANVAVPEAVSVTGYDDSDLAALSYLNMTAIKQDVDHTVDATISAIQRRIANHEANSFEVATPTVLTIRGTTGHAPAIATISPDVSGRS